MHTKHPVVLMTVLFLLFAWEQQSTHGIRGSRRKQLAALVSVLSRDRKWKMTTGWKAADPCETIWVCNLELITGGLLPPQQSLGGRGPGFWS